MFSFPITADFHTAAPPRAVWAAFQAVERWPEVIPDLVGAAIEPPGPLAAGSVIHASAGPVGAAVDIEYRVTLAEEPHRLTLESDTLDWNGRTEYTIEPEGAGTRLIVHSTLEVIGTLLRIQMFVVGRRMTAQREAALRVRTQALLSLAEKMA